MFLRLGALTNTRQRILLLEKIAGAEETPMQGKRCGRRQLPNNQGIRHLHEMRNGRKRHCFQYV
jgi:hypothetical protein